MNPRLATTVVGTIMIVLGLAGLLYPERVMGVLGFVIASPAHASATLGEVRATYGGIFLVMGVYTLLAAFEPGRHRARLLLIGLLWLGAFGGRLLGVFTDGNPGVAGWLALVFELVMGGALVLASQTAEPLEPAQTAESIPA
jgi:hypothetical protein